MAKRFYPGLLMAAVLGMIFISGCTNKQAETEAPVFLTVDFASAPLGVNVAVSAPVTYPTITVTSHFKNPTATDPQHFADVQLSSYIVTYTRTQGGTKVPAPESFGGFGLVPSGGTGTLSGLPGMYAYALQQSPFDQLFPFNGGIDEETGLSEIAITLHFVFYGETASGHRVQSEPGSTPLIFQYSAQ